MHTHDVDDDMSGGEKEIPNDGPFGGLGISDAGRTGTVQIDERENQSSELLDAAGVGCHHRDASQKRGMDRKRIRNQNTCRRNKQSQI